MRSLLALALVLLAQAASALIMVGGKEPVSDHNWPAGSLDVANHKSRLIWYEGPPFGGGEYTFVYRGDTATLNELLARFAQEGADPRRPRCTNRASSRRFFADRSA